MEQITLVLTQADVNCIADALAAQPLGKSINTFIKLQQQVAQQSQAVTPSQVAAEQREAATGNGTLPDKQH